LVDPPLPQAGQIGAFSAVVPSLYWPEEHCAETLARRRVLKRRRRVTRIVVIFGLFGKNDGFGAPRWRKKRISRFDLIALELESTKETMFDEAETVSVGNRQF